MHSQINEDRLNIDMSSYQYIKIPIIKIRRFHDRLMIIMEIPYLERSSIFWDVSLETTNDWNTVRLHLAFVMSNIPFRSSYGFTNVSILCVLVMIH